MLRPGTARRALAAAFTAAAVACGAVPSAATAADVIVATDNQFAAGTYAMAPGERPEFQNDGPFNRHDVFSRGLGPDGARLFTSPTLDPGFATGVDGTQYLTVGTYPFFCNIHPLEMSGTLSVSGPGSPVPRPSVALKGKGGKLQKLAKKGKLAVTVTAATESNGVKLVAKLGKATVGSAAAFNLAAGQSRKTTVKLSKSGKAKLKKLAKKRKKATIKVTGSVPFGAPRTVKLSFK